MKGIAILLRTALWCSAISLCGVQYSRAETGDSRPTDSSSVLANPYEPLNLSLARSTPASTASWQMASPASNSTTSTPSEHRFWDGENIVLFSLVGASRALDYSSTLNMRRRGRQEIFLTNDIVDNHPAFAAIEAAATALSIGASYLFHRYHHHRLERYTSIIHASLSTGGAIRNYCLKTEHSSTTP